MDRMSELRERLKLYSDGEALLMLRELLQLRREHYRNLLESTDSAEVRGKAKECRDLLSLFD